MTVPVPVTLTTIQAAGWGAIVASDVNGLLARATALEAVNAGPRLGTAESEIDGLQAITTAVGARNGHTYVPGDTIANNEACPFNDQGFLWALTVNPFFTEWVTTIAGVYSVSWGCEISAASSVTLLDVNSFPRAGGSNVVGNWSYGSWTGYLPVSTALSVRYVGITTPYTDGFIDIFRVAQGG